MSGGFDMLRGNFDFDIGEDLKLIINSLIIVLQCVEIGVAKEDSLKLVVGGFRGCERCGEGEEVVVGLETGLFERGLEEVWTVTLCGCEILFDGFEIWVTGEETERSNGSSVIFCEIRIFESYEAVFFKIGFVGADFGEIVVVFEEEEGKDEINEKNNT